MHSHFSLTHYRVYFAKDLIKRQSDSICQVIYTLYHEIPTNPTNSALCKECGFCQAHGELLTGVSKEAPITAWSPRWPDYTKSALFGDTLYFF